MKKTRFTKTLSYGICSLVIAAIILLTIGYFGKEESAQKNDSSQSDKKQEQVSKPKDSKENKVDNSNNQSVKQQLTLHSPCQASPSDQVSNLDDLHIFVHTTSYVYPPL